MKRVRPEGAGILRRERRGGEQQEHSGFSHEELRSSYPKRTRGRLKAAYARHAYIVATPIGNLEDMTFRAVRVLEEANWIACEDTRQTRKLLDHYGIDKPVVSYHEHNEAARAEELAAKVLAGDTGALVSDAGTPLISDPGYRVVARRSTAGIPVVAIPGASAAVSPRLRPPGSPPTLSASAVSCPPSRAAGARARNAAGGRGHADFLRSAAPDCGGAGGDRRGDGDRPVVAARE